MQQVQVLPVQNSTGAGGQPIMLQSQVIQTADGQTLIYQPVQVSKIGDNIKISLFFLVKIVANSMKDSKFERKWFSL